MAVDSPRKNVVIIGAGRSGLALCDYFCRKGATVVLSDNRAAEQIALDPQALPRGVVCDFGGHDPALLAKADLVVLSPGVPLTIPSLEAVRQQGIPVVGEIEVAYESLSAPLVAITGTNGKSTTTTLMGEVFNAWGKKTFVGGNLGTPLVDAAQSDDWDWVVAEVSSFQLEGIRCFHPRYALLLNLSADHLDRYPDMAAYCKAKARVFENLTASDTAVLNAEDDKVLELASRCPARKVFFSSDRVLPEGMGFDGRNIVWRFGGEEQHFDSEQLLLRGRHNVENVMAALIPPLLEGCPAGTAWQRACTFGGLKHRMTVVRQLGGVTWYNDSKGTNVGSVVKSLAGLDSPVTLIAGGKDKGGDYGPLVGPIRQKVDHLILIGQAANRMAEAFEGAAAIVRAASMEEAVALARQHTPAGGSVLLSPGCSSFDMFRSFEERGDVFTQAVLALPERTTP